MMKPSGGIKEGSFHLDWALDSTREWTHLVLKHIRNHKGGFGAGCIARGIKSPTSTGPGRKMELGICNHRMDLKR